MFTSQSECLAAQPSPTDDAIACIEMVLSSSSNDENANIEFLQCYQAALRDNMMCFTEEVAETCSASAQSECSMALSQANDACQGQLTVDEAEAIIYCTTP